MKVGQFAKCVQPLGNVFTVGNYYEIFGVRPTNGACLLRSDKGEELWLFVGEHSQLVPSEYGPSQMQEPIFDLEDMELAEILIDEMKK